MIVDKKLIRLACTNSLFKGVPENELRSFIKPKNFFTVEDGKIIYSPDNETKEIYLIVEGEVKIKFSEARKVEHKFILDFFGEGEILKESNRVSSAVVNKNSILYKITTEELKLLTNQKPVIMSNLNKEENIAQEEYKNFILPDTQEQNAFDFTDGVIDATETIPFHEEEVANELSDEDLNAILEEQMNKRNTNIKFK